MSGVTESQTSPADIINAAQQVEISVLKEQLFKLENKINAWGSTIDKLEGMFSAWQERLDAVLDNADIALVSTGNDLTSLGTIVGIFAVIITAIAALGVAFIIQKRIDIFNEIKEDVAKRVEKEVVTQVTDRLNAVDPTNNRFYTSNDSPKKNIKPPTNS